MRPRPPAPAAAPDPGALAPSDRLARTLSRRGLGPILVTFFGLGLLLSFTPCVLPMVPILSSLVVGQGGGVRPAGRSRALALSAAYVGAMAVTYAAAGVLAGLSGANLQIVFQHPAVLVVFALVFVALAGSMFGLYELQLPSRWQSALTRVSARQRGGSYAGAAVMGFLSALIVGPCVAAPLAGALLYISRTGDALVGGAALLALALGMGLPLLAVGASAGALLPRAGPWMASVKRLFGFILLGVAVYLIERLLPDGVALALWAVLLMVGAIYMGALDGLDAAASGWRRLGKGAGLAVLVYGILLMVGAAAGGDDVFNPLARLAGGAAARPGLEFRPVKGNAGLDAALAEARRAARPVVLDYYADWCVTCKDLERHTFRDPAVRAALAGVQLLRTDVTGNDPEDRALLARFGLFGPPAILFFGPDGRERPRYRVIGYMSAEEFRAHAEAALGGLTLAAR